MPFGTQRSRRCAAELRGRWVVTVRFHSSCCCCGKAPRSIFVQHLQELCIPNFSYEVVDASGNVLCRSTDCK